MLENFFHSDWALADVMGVCTATIAIVNLPALEAAILFIASMIFFYYRISILRTEDKKKKRELKKMDMELEEKNFDFDVKKAKHEETKKDIQ